MPTVLVFHLLDTELRSSLLVEFQQQIARPVEFHQQTEITFFLPDLSLAPLRVSLLSLRAVYAEVFFESLLIE